MTHRDHVKQARSMFAMANRMATLLLTNSGVKDGDWSSWCEVANKRWKPLHDAAAQYARQHNISKHEI